MKREKEDFKGDLDRHVSAVRDEYVTFFQNLLRIPTPRMQEHDAMHFVADAIRAAAWDVEVFAGRGEGEPTPDGVPINLLARRRGSGGGRSLLLEAHMDTVPPGDPSRWTHGPWSGHIDSGRIFGRGAHDDRGGVVAVCMLAEVLRRLNPEICGNVYLLITTEEEFSCGGMKAFLDHPSCVVPDAHVLVDGNRDVNTCILGHPGAISFEVLLPGAWGSAQLVDKVCETNPIELASLLICELSDHETAMRELQKKSAQGDPWPPAIVAVTEIAGGQWLANIPEECLLRGWGNVYPPLTLGQYKQCFEERVRTFAQRHAWLREHPPMVHWGPLEVEAMRTPESSELYRMLAEAHEESFAVPLSGRLIGGWGDMTLLGSPNQLFYGPGRGGGDHTYDEFYELADLSGVVKTLGQLVRSWCGDARPRPHCSDE